MSAREQLGLEQQLRLVDAALRRDFLGEAVVDALFAGLPVAKLSRIDS